MRLHATGCDLIIQERERIVSGSVNVHKCEFTFDSSWDGYTVTAVFSSVNRTVNMPIVNGVCDIPVEVMRAKTRFHVGIVGVNGDVTRPTIYSDWVQVEQGVDTNAVAGRKPTQSVYEQWIGALDEKFEEWEAYEKARQEAEKVRMASENARVDAEARREGVEAGYVAQSKAWAETSEMWAKAAQEIALGDAAGAVEATVDAAVSAHNLDDGSHADLRQDVSGLAVKVEKKGEDLAYDADTNRLFMTKDGVKIGSGVELPKTGGSPGSDGNDGSDGSGGSDGANGTDGFSPIVDATKVDGVTTLTITDKYGTESVNILDGKDGEDGKTPQKGIDYFTESERQTMVNEVVAALPESQISKIDLSGWADGEFEVTMSDNTTLDGEVTFKNGRPKTITLNGHTLTLTLPPIPEVE